MAATMELKDGEAIGPYRIEALIGRGRMGRVYRATDGDGTAVALKTVTSELVDDPTFRRRFRREANAARRIRHPHVVPVLDEGEHGEMPYIVQAFVPGGTLADRIARSPLDLAGALRLLGQVADGLDALHGAGLVHRDVKPANILLEGDKAYVADFGLAKDSQASVLTRPGQALGSLNYMAPEQIRGEAVSPATDVYALGCVLWESLTGSPPFGGRASMRTLFAHLQEHPGSIADVRDDIPPPAARAIGRALAKDADDRPTSAPAYVDAVARAAGLP